MAVVVGALCTCDPGYHELGVHAPDWTPPGADGADLRTCLRLINQ